MHLGYTVYCTILSRVLKKERRSIHLIPQHNANSTKSTKYPCIAYIGCQHTCGSICVEAE